MRSRELRDRDWPALGRMRKVRTELGLELLMLRARSGVGLTQDDIAAWCGCTDVTIHQIEKAALRKLRNMYGQDNSGQISSD